MKLRNKKVFTAAMISLSLLCLNGCGKDEISKDGEYKENGVFAYQFNISEEEYLQVYEDNNGIINKTCYSDLENMVNNDTDYFKLLSPSKFSFSHFDNLTIHNLSISNPDNNFDFNSISSIDGLESVEFRLNSNSNFDSLFDYLNEFDFQNVDLKFVFDDYLTATKFDNRLAKNGLSAKSVVIETENIEFLKNISKINAKTLVFNQYVSGNISSNIYADLNKNVNYFKYMFISNDDEGKVCIDNIVINSSNDKISVYIGSDYNVDLVIPDNSSMNIPENTYIDIKDSQSLKLN